MPTKGKCSICGKENYLTMMPLWHGDTLYARMVCHDCYELYLKLEKAANAKNGKAEGKGE